LQFAVGDYVYLKVSPMRGVHQFGVSGKLAPRYVGPYKILEQCVPVAYRLQLPDILSAVHDMFHVSVDTKCDALCLTHSKPKSVASIGFPGASLSGSVPVSLT